MVESGLLSAENRDMLLVSDTIEDLLEKMKNYQAPLRPKWLTKDEGFEHGGDGIEAVGNGDYIVTCWPGVVYLCEGRTVSLLSQRFTGAGYRTAWIWPKQHLGAKPQGFDYLQRHTEQIEGYVSDIVTEKAEKWLDTLNKDKPFCLILGHKATHRSWLPDPKDFGTYDQTEIPLPDNFYDQYDKRKAAAVQEMSIAKDMLLPYDLKMYFFPTKEDMRKDYGLFPFYRKSV
ncbi:hypothetical protein FQR65_LT16027 [Abscondita terminalis]|nr:hypothetical protein FQR65_LT16027 [Abscondita terminalis]